MPPSWSKHNEFNESDLRCALDTIDVWLDTIALGRTNLPPNKVPFDAFVASFENDCKLVVDDDFNLAMLILINDNSSGNRSIISSNNKPNNE